jgi:hypothetical protein
MFEAMASTIKNGTGHVVEHGGQHGGDNGQQRHHAKGLCSGPLRGPYGQYLEEAGFPNDVHDDHHADQEKDDVVIHPKLMRIKCFLLSQNA